MIIFLSLTNPKSMAHEAHKKNLSSFILVGGGKICVAAKGKIGGRKEQDQKR